MEYSKIETADTFNLFDVGPYKTATKDKARKATEQECKVYAQWLALKSGILAAESNLPKLEWRETGRTRNDKICIGAYFGEEFVAFPGADQNGAVEFEILGDDGEPVSSTTLYKKTKGAGAGGLQLLKADKDAIKKAAKEPAPVVAEIESEPVPVVDTVPAAPALAGEYDALDTPSEGIDGESQGADEKPMFASVAEFKRAATVGTIWARSDFENGQWQDRSPILRTVAKVQTHDIICGMAVNAKCGEEHLHQIASLEKSGQWLGFPKKGRWESDSEGMIWLDMSGRKMFRLEPVDPDSLIDPQPIAEKLVSTGKVEIIAVDRNGTRQIGQPATATEPQAEAPAMVEAAPVEIDAPSEPDSEIEAIEPEAFTLSGTIRATIQRGGAWDWSQGYQGNETHPSEAIAPAVHDDRPRRLRIARAYLRMRKERAKLYGHIAAQHKRHTAQMAAKQTNLDKWAAEARKGRKAQSKRRRAVLNAKRHWEMRLVARSQYQEAEKMEAVERAGRRSIAKTGRGLAEKARRERDQARAELAKIKANRADPTNPERASDLIKLRDERDQARGRLEMIAAERDRLKATIAANAGTLDEMIDRAFRAEAELRDAKAPRGYQMSAPVIAFRQAA